MSARTCHRRACYFLLMRNWSLLQHCEQPCRVGSALISQSCQDPFQTYIVLDLCDIWQAIDVPFPSYVCQQHSYCCIYCILKTTVVLTITLGSPNCPCYCSDSHSCNSSNSVARSEVRGIIAVKVDFYLFLP